MKTKNQNLKIHPKEKGESHLRLPPVLGLHVGFFGDVPVPWILMGDGKSLKELRTRPDLAATGLCYQFMSKGGGKTIYLSILGSLGGKCR